MEYALCMCVVCEPTSGDVMGPTLNNLDKLLRLPFGCGEQNMIHFAPNVFVLKYLQKTRQLSPEVENEATDYLLQGKETAAQPHSGFHDILHPEINFLNPLEWPVQSFKNFFKKGKYFKVTRLYLFAVYQCDGCKTELNPSPSLLHHRKGNKNKLLCVWRLSGGKWIWHLLWMCWFRKHPGEGAGPPGCCLWCAWEPVSQILCGFCVFNTSVSITCHC